ncbi:MAG: methyltransferase domain-containing protein [Magnetococcales bacterium]|nr:methyltransferase domain-containing protein [Magnetococcales bacterium]
MVPRQVKAAYYLLMAIPLWLSGRWYRVFRAPRQGIVRVHLGSGQVHYIPGWINLDANMISARADVRADLRHALPFHDSTVDAFYSHHVIEHLTNTDLIALLHDIHRCLKPGGVVRLAGPHGDMAMRQYIAGNHAWFSDFPENRRSLGGRLANFLLCQGEHLAILTPGYLEELLIDVGFDAIRSAAPVTLTHHPDRFGPEVLDREHETTPEAPHTLVMEAVKPGKLQNL